MQEGKKTNQNQWEEFQTIKQIIFDLNKENLVQSAKSIVKKFNQNHPLSLNPILYQMIYTILVISKTKIFDFDLYLDFINEIKIIQEKKNIKSEIFNEFAKFLLNKNTQESHCLLNYMIEHNFLKPEIVKNQKGAYFAHYISSYEKIQNLFYNYVYFMDEIYQNYKELSKNNWELHKRYTREGVNQNKIAKIIRNDEIEKLQEISSQNDFNFNKIEPSPYERCSFINKLYEGVSLIDYASFFGSIKCFKFFLMNDANVKYSGKYAVAGENIEIIHLCEQNHSSFKNAFKTAIKFHLNNVFKYIYETKLEKIKDLSILGKKCILYHNYEIFSFLLKEGMEINDIIINEAAKVGNIFLVEYFLLNNQIPKNILIYSSNSGNIELVKYVLNQKGIDINAKDIYLFYLKFILII